MSDSNLDFLLRKAIRSGLNYLSLSPNYANPNGAAWNAAYRHAGTNNCQYVDHDDPIEAIEKAIRAGEREAKAKREQDAELAPLRDETEKIQRRNSSKVAKEKEAKEAAARKRRRDAEDLA